MSLFGLAIDRAVNSLAAIGQSVHTESWQGVDISSKPEMRTWELLNYTLKAQVYTEDLSVLGGDIKPNLPWADNHFQERVCGYPLNPGTEWENWPYGKSAAKFLDESGMFNHSYAERYWPKFAGTLGPTQNPIECAEILENSFHPGHRGIRESYGDLNDVVSLLLREPHTRQAYLPIFFPEDTGGAGGGRVPCSLGYHFIRRRNYLHVTYWLRSCDLVRHFRDDIYLTVRLLLWVLDELRKRDPNGWSLVNPGFFTMHTTSLHCFENDYRLLIKERT